jgi:hypothetical protein
MALNRRAFFLTLPLSAGVAVVSSSCARRLRVAPGYVELATSSPGAAAKATILVVMPETAQTKEVWTGLHDELGKQYRLVAVRAEGSTAAAAIGEGMRRHRPSAVVLMNNPTVVAYRNFQHESGLAQFPPAVIVMTSFLEGQSTQIVGATGISYEVPLITVVTNLRKLIATPIERVGVIVRAAERDLVRRQADLARREQISVILEEVSSNPNASELKGAIRKLKRQIDALWILNDDQLLTPRLIADGWLPGLDERPFCPSIVGAASLVSPSNSFGTFAVLPDHAALGVQAANILFDLADHDWILSASAQVEAPLSTTTTVDLVQARERFSLREDALKQVDKILE